MTAGTVARVVKEITAAERAAFLKHVRQGANRWEAARAVDQTASMFRGLAATDPKFRAAYEAACAEREALAEEAREDYRDALRSILAQRALNPEERSSRFLLAEAATHLPEYGWMRDRRRGTSEPQSEFPIPQVEMANFTSAQLEELETVAARFWELIAIGQGRVANPELGAEGEAA